MFRSLFFAFLGIIAGSFAHAQVSFVLKDKSFAADARTLTLEVKPIFDLDTVALSPLFGEESPTKRPDTASFYIEYENVPSEKQVLAVPSFIWIENLSKAVYPMPSPVYSPDEIDKSSTKSWKLTFSSVPEYAGCVRIFLAGTYLEIGDMPLAEKSRTVRLENFLTERKKNQFNFADINPSEYDSLTNEIKVAITEFISKQGNANYVGKMSWSVDTLGINKFTLLDDTCIAEPLELELKRKFSERKLPLSKKMDFPILTKAEFSILVASGTYKINNATGKPTFRPGLYNDEVKTFVKKRLAEKARFRVQFQYASINGQPIPFSTISVKKTFLNREQQNIFIFGSFAAIGIFTALLTAL